MKEKSQVSMKFFAKTVPTILVLGGILGWLMCGVTQQNVFCQNWLGLIVLGVAVNVLWLFYWIMKTR
jgi:uncharacterized membrane protein